MASFLLPPAILFAINYYFVNNPEYMFYFGEWGYKICVFLRLLETASN